MNIAHCVEFYPPSVGGMQEVVRQLSERMVRSGHAVTVFTSDLPARHGSHLNGVDIRSFPLSGNASLGIHGDTTDYITALKEGRFDVITFFAAQQWTTDAALPHLSAFAARKVFVPTGFSGLNKSVYAPYYAAMPAWMKQMDLNVFLSTTYQDADFARAHGVEKTTLIPNGAAAEEFEGIARYDIRQELALPPKDLLILHLGSYTGAKGQGEAMRIFLRSRRTKGHALALIGNGVHELGRSFGNDRNYFLLRWKARLTGRKILFLEWDRARTVAALQQSDLFLFPSLVECSPIVLFEAMAAGTPFLASNAGNAAEIAEWSDGGWILPGTRHPDGWEQVNITAGAQLLDVILADRARMQEKGRNGNSAWKERFTWQRITEQYLTAYASLIGKAHE